MTLVSSLKDGTDETENSAEWSDIFASLLYQGTMTHEQILNHSIPYIFAITPKITEIRMNTISMGMFGGLPSPTARSGTHQAIEHEGSVEDFINGMNGIL